MTDTLGAFGRVRPCRIAFFIDPTDCPAELFDALVGTALNLWGGRGHVIIPVELGTISDGYWNLLDFVDPDIIYTYIDLPEPLLRRINRVVCPLEVRAHPAHALAETPPNYQPFNLVYNLAGIHPWLPVVLARERRLQRARMLTSRAYGDWNARRFVLRNFGILEETGLLRQYLEPSDTLPLTEDRTEAMVMSEITGESGRVVFPHGVAAYWADLEEPRGGSHECAVTLGDDVWSSLFAWNRGAHVSTYLREQWHTMWVPPALLQEPDFRSALMAFLNRYVLRYASTPPRLQIWHSTASGIADADARALLGEGLRGVDCIPEYHELIPGQFPTTACDYDRFQQFAGPPGLRQYRPRVFQIQASEPSFLMRLPVDIAGRASGTKMLDFLVEYRREWHAYTNQRFWWRLPKVLGITRFFGDYSTIGRVSSDGVPSIMIGPDAAALSRTSDCSLGPLCRTVHTDLPYTALPHADRRHQAYDRREWSPRRR